jgi:hypothetical protein
VGFVWIKKSSKVPYYVSVDKEDSAPEKIRIARNLNVEEALKPQHHLLTW